MVPIEATAVIGGGDGLPVDVGAVFGGHIIWSVVFCVFSHPFAVSAATNSAPCYARPVRLHKTLKIMTKKSTRAQKNINKRQHITTTPADATKIHARPRKMAMAALPGCRDGNYIYQARCSRESLLATNQAAPAIPKLCSFHFFFFPRAQTCARTRHFSTVDFWYSGDFPTNSSPLSESRQASRYFAHAPSCSQKRGTVVLAGFLCSAASVCLFDAGGKGSLDVRNRYESKRRRKEEEKQKRNTCSLQMPIRFFFFLILAGCPRRNSIRHKTRDGRKGRQGKVATYLARALTQPFVSRFLILDYKTGRAKRKKKHLKNLRCSGIVVRTGNFLFV